jgi:hypothetical protein
MVKVCETVCMKKFAYLFTLGGKIVRSSENQVSLNHRMESETEHVQREVEDFALKSNPGDFMQMPTGEFIFCTAL